jgi:hypothetical protein
VAINIDYKRELAFGFLETTVAAVTGFTCGVIYRSGALKTARVFALMVATSFFIRRSLINLAPEHHQFKAQVVLLIIHSTVTTFALKSLNILSRRTAPLHIFLETAAGVYSYLSCPEVKQTFLKI